MNELIRKLLNLPPQASSAATGIDHLHALIIAATFAGVALTAAITIYFVVRYRRRAEAQRTPRIVAPAWLELGVAAAMFALFGGWWIIGFSQYRDLETPPADAMPIYVTAKQWMWEFAYPDGPTSADVLVVPVGKPIVLIMSSRDVIHSFYVPAFRIKQDVVPGRAMKTWFEATVPGTYDILCTQYCGTKHSYMRGQVIALAPADYASWREHADKAPRKGTGSGLAARGLEVAAERGCLRCHSTDGTRFVGPSFIRLYGADRELSDGRHVVADEAYLTESMMDPQAKLVRGFQPVMPSYRGALTPEDTAAILEYLRSQRDAAPPRLPPAELPK
ncbi:MAG TPA: cytochrome c oxidase subunit II [Kofleriaceae bacterium]